MGIYVTNYQFQMGMRHGSYDKLDDFAPLKKNIQNRIFFPSSSFNSITRRVFRPDAPNSCCPSTRRRPSVLILRHRFGC
ncbi:hypothetical protein VNO80_16462 [Phaseolus coccineus]|uniref:Uncharacterized protein n=1 Tax=Phaseolus coccineus TaxID=3886 RepID=A0AAN9MM65_PHACN